MSKLSPIMQATGETTDAKNAENSVPGKMLRASTTKNSDGILSENGQSTDNTGAEGKMEVPGKKAKDVLGMQDAFEISGQTDDTEMSIALKATLRMQVPGKKVDTLLCDACEIDGKTINAEGYCKNCKEYLCSECFMIHCRPLAMHGHKLLDKASMPKVRPMKEDNYELVDKCLDHPYKLIEFICQNEMVLGCQICMMKNHKNCEDEVKIHINEEVALNMNEEMEMETFYKSLIETQKMIKSTKAKLEANKMASKCYTENALKEVQKMRAEVEKEFEEIEQLVKEQSKKISEENDTKTDSFIKATDKEETEVNEIKTSIEQKRKDRKKCQMYIELLRSKATLAATCKSLDENKATYTIDRFKIGEKLKKIKTVCTEVKELCDKTGLLEMVPATQLIENQGETMLSHDEHVINCLIQITESMFLISFQGEKYFWVYDIPTEICVSKYAFNSEIGDMTMIDNEQVAFTMPATEVLPVFSLANEKVVKLIPVPENCQGIQTWKESLIVSYPYQQFLKMARNIAIIDYSGAVIKFLYRDGNSEILHLAVSPKEDLIYAADMINHRVLAISPNGQVIATYSDKELKSPYGITTDDSGQVYVCGRDSNNVHVLSPKAKKIQVLLKELPQPSCVRFSSIQNKLYISCGANVKEYLLL